MFVVRFTNISSLKDKISFTSFLDILFSNDISIALCLDARVKSFPTYLFLECTNACLPFKFTRPGAAILLLASTL